MKDINMEILIPSNGNCITWKNTDQEVCTYLTMRKDALKPKIMFKCTLLNKDLTSNINAFGILNICEVKQKQKGNVYKL